MSLSRRNLRLLELARSSFSLGYTITLYFKNMTSHLITDLQKKVTALQKENQSFRKRKEITLENHESFWEENRDMISLEEFWNKMKAAEDLIEVLGERNKAGQELVKAFLKQNQDIQEQNKAMYKKNKVLQGKNKALQKENRASWKDHKVLWKKDKVFWDEEMAISSSKLILWEESIAFKENDWKIQKEKEALGDEKLCNLQTESIAFAECQPKSSNDFTYLFRI
uniref:Uncharacterized protein n=1 Tax=Coturnix japonica TaxID=93934 RepID=A0A8C2TZX0_COTJA